MSAKPIGWARRAWGLFVLAGSVGWIFARRLFRRG
jgi:hypothetical protein